MNLLAKKLKHKDNIPWQNLDKTVIILNPTGQVAHELNELASWYWLNMQEAIEVSELIGRVSEEFDVELKQATVDLTCFITELEDNGLIECQ